jgi:hypothetical protein
VLVVLCACCYQYVLISIHLPLIVFCVNTFSNVLCVFVSK